MNRSRHAALAAALFAALAAQPQLARAQDSDGAEPAAPAPPPPPTPEPVAPTPNEAAELLSKSSQTILGSPSLSFSITMRAEGFLAQHSPDLRARVVLLRAPAGNDWIVRITGSGKMSPSAQEQNFDASWQTAFVEWVEHSIRTLRRQPGRPRGGSQARDFTPANQLKVDWLMGPTPWAREITSADSAVILDPQTIDGVECRTIELAVRGPSGGKRRIAIAESDMIPRRYEHVFEGQLAGSMIFDISDVSLTDPVTQEQTRVVPPEGYTVEPEPQPPQNDPAPSPAPIIQPPVADAQPAPAPAPPPLPAPASRPAPGFELKNAAGETLRLESLRGRVVLLWFWGTWSLPSRDALPELDRLADRFNGSPVSVLGLSVRERVPAAGAELLADRKLDLATLLNADAVAAAFGVRTFPTFVLVDAEGQIIETVEGFPKDATLDALAERIADELRGLEPETPKS